MKYVYRYQTVKCEFFTWGLAGGNVYETQGHREIIEQMAAQGWRYAGFIPTKQRGTGHIAEIDLIFEKEEQ